MAKLELPLSKEEFSFKYTLGGGQSFRWYEVEDDAWLGVLGKSVLKFYRTEDSSTRCSILSTLDSFEEVQRQVNDFLRTNIDIKSLYDKWNEADGYFNELSKAAPGVRLLRQDPLECLFAFICSSNNNIPRITGMMAKLCRHYGEPIGAVEGEMYHSFPRARVLADPKVEEELRQLGFGYRARYINQTAKALVEQKEEWLQGLRSQADYLTAREALTTLPGVGPKVADCVCLMGLDKLEAIPVDTHVWQVAQRHYGFGRAKTSRTVTAKLYADIGMPAGILS